MTCAQMGRVPRDGMKKLAASLVVCIICVATNIVGAQVTTALSLPLFLDSLGTVFAAMLGGYVPGILVGYLTNIFISFFDSVSLYYAVVSALIAVVVATAARRNWFGSIPKAVGTTLILACLSGGTSSVLTWCMYGFSFGSGISAPLAQRLYTSGIPPFASQLLADVAIDLADKAVVITLVLLVVRLLPAQLGELLDFTLWQQTPLSRQDLAAARTEKARVASLQTKVIVMVSAIMIVVVVVTTWISHLMFTNSLVDEQIKTAYGITSLMEDVIDPSHVDAYLSEGDSAEGYQEVEAELAGIRDSFPDVQYVYVYRILPDGCHVVLDPDTADEAGSDPGEVVAFDQAFMPYLDDLLAGKAIDPLISNESYGWLLTVYQPLYDANGTCVCYLAVDILMDHITQIGYTFLARVVALFGAFFILICAVILWLAEYCVILPLNSIANATSGFAFDSAGDRADTVDQVKRLGIHTGDEIENLYLAVLKTAEDTMDYIADAEEKARTIERMQDNLIMVMADLVESRDQFTGDHVRKTAEYARVIMAQMREEGMYADQLTDEFISDVSHSAPLHDIGKIVVSDTILNKPGRLTDEEFALMKNHTTAGREILERAVGAMSDPGYLDEAKNLAEFHHEKWDGSGYPTGLAGEDIPLSARIMAVADVFDALVSKRSYKDGFPLDKAFAIIEEGMGSHFDPQIAGAFLRARDKAEAIARHYGDGQTDKE